MRDVKSSSRLLSFLLIFSIILTLGEAAFGQSASNTKRDQRIASLLKDSLQGPVSKERPRITKTADGYVRFISTPLNTSLSVDAVQGRGAEAQARTFLAKWEDLFVKNPARVDYRLRRIPTSGNRSYVHFSQTYGGVPVFGSEVMVQINGQGGVESVNNNLMQDTSELDNGQVSLRPSIDAAKARQNAIALMSLPGRILHLQATGPVLMIYDPLVVGAEGPTQLVWQTVVSDSTAAIAEQILVDAVSGEIALNFTLIRDAKKREIYDANNQPGVDPGTLARTEGQAASTIVDVNQAYDNYGATYDFYKTYNLRDSIDGLGMTMSATTRFIPEGTTAPFENAFWDGYRMYFGEGFAAADDVVAHELTHGVTQYTSNLMYLNQPGAINESLSDMWGEWIDQVYVTDTDTSSTKWLLGEDIPSIGAIRNMKNPPLFRDPDRMGSIYYYTGPNDNGGVHINSGVGNKLCYLLTDGDRFNGFTIKGMGLTKTCKLFYECQTKLLTETSKYADLANALARAAVNLGYSVPDRENIDQACVAVEIQDETSIIEDPDAPNVQFELQDVTLPEGGSALLKVTLSFPATKNATVNYSANSGSATGGGVDYILQKGTLNFKVGESAKTIPVKIMSDNQPEPDEVFMVTLASAVGINLNRERSYVNCHIINDGSLINVQSSPANLVVTHPDGSNLTPCLLAKTSFAQSWLAVMPSDGNGCPFLKWQANGKDVTNNIRLAIRFPARGQTATYNAVYSKMRVADALNNSSLTWNWNTAVCWYGQTGITHDNKHALQSGRINNNGRTSFETVVNGPGTISFWWKVSSEADHDWLGVYDNNTLIPNCRISGVVDWKNKTLWVPDGQHVISWRYEKDKLGARNSDCGWVDSVSFTRKDLAVASPQGGERFKAGGTIAVGCYKSQAAGTTVRFELWQNSKKVATLGSGTISGNYGSKTLKVPANVPQGTGYRVRAISARSPKLWDQNANTFSIQR